MYNSRPRVSRFTSEFELPRNYSGNAFREAIAPPPAEVEEQKREAVQEEDVASTAAKTVVEDVCMQPEKKKGLLGGAGFGFDVGRLFSGGIGYEELLILGLILLVAQNEGNEDVLILLVLLLFVG